MNDMITMESRARIAFADGTVDHATAFGPGRAPYVAQARQRLVELAAAEGGHVPFRDVLIVLRPRGRGRWLIGATGPLWEGTP